MNYYNEFEPKAAAALMQLISDGLIPAGDVDTRSIKDVRPEDLAGYTQCHFFAGIGGWSRALELARWPANRPVWTGSCPCQPFSSAGKQKGKADERHLWPTWFGLIKECRPAIVFGEQVASAVSHGWLDGVYADMEAEGYAIGSAVLPACAVDAPHKRDRLWFVADAHREQRNGCWGSGKRRRPEFADGSMLGNPKHDGSHGCEVSGCDAQAVQYSATRTHGTGEFEGTGASRALSESAMGDTLNEGLQGQCGDGGAAQGRQEQGRSVAEAGFWSDTEWIICGDGKARRVKSGIRLLVDGFPERVGLLRAGGNAIVPEVAARFIEATM